MLESRINPDDGFRRTMTSLAIGVRSLMRVDTHTSISLGVGEAIDIRPQYPFGLLLRLISYESLAGDEISFCFALRQNGQIDNVDEQLRYIPIEGLDPIARIDRELIAERSAQALVAMSTNQSRALSASRLRQAWDV